MEEILNLKIVKKINSQFQQNEKLGDDNYDIVSCIGAGAFGKVFKIQSKLTNKIYAKKLLSVNVIFRQNLQNLLKNEIEVLANCDHKYIIKILAIYQEDETFNLIMEYFDGLNLFQIIKKQKQFTEEQAKRIIFEIVQGLCYLHEQDPPILHRDLKSENILYKDGVIKIIDFGWSNKFDEYRNTFCGTPDYFCPEMINGTGHDEKLDIWSLGILTYELLQGQLPFTPDVTNMNQRMFQKEVEKNILEGKIIFKKDISQQSQDFINLLLQKDPQKRPNTKEILGNEYFIDYQNTNKNFQKKISTKSKDEVNQLKKVIDTLKTKNDYYKQKLNYAQKLLEKQKGKIKNLQNKFPKSKTFEDKDEESLNIEQEKTQKFAFFRSKTAISKDSQSQRKSEILIDKNECYEDEYYALKKKIDKTFKKMFDSLGNEGKNDFQKTMYKLDKILQSINKQKKNKKPPTKKSSNISNLKNSNSKKFTSKKSENKSQNLHPKLFISDFSYSDNKLQSKLKSFF